MAAPSTRGGKGESESGFFDFVRRLVGAPKPRAEPPSPDDLVVQLHARHHEAQRVLEQTHRPQLRECARRIAEYRREFGTRAIPPPLVKAYRNAHRLVCTIEHQRMLVDDAYLAITAAGLMRDTADTIHMTTTVLRREAESGAGLTPERVEQIAEKYEEQLADLAEVQTELDNMVSRATETGLAPVADTTDFDEQFAMDDAELADIQAIADQQPELRDADFPQVPRPPTQPPVAAHTAPSTRKATSPVLTS